MSFASLAWDAAPATAGAVVLVMHGGSIEGRQPNRAWSHNVARLYPIARDLAAAAPPRPLAVARLRFRWRGWNGDERSPVADARWALGEVRSRYPDVPIALVGHSMGAGPRSTSPTTRGSGCWSGSRRGSRPATRCRRHRSCRPC
jgi:hypothetical protein